MHVHHPYRRPDTATADRMQTQQDELLNYVAGKDGAGADAGGLGLDGGLGGGGGGGLGGGGRGDGRAHVAVVDGHLGGGMYGDEWADDQVDYDGGWEEDNEEGYAMGLLSLYPEDPGAYAGSASGSAGRPPSPFGQDGRPGSAGGADGFYDDGVTAVDDRGVAIACLGGGPGDRAYPPARFRAADGLLERQLFSFSAVPAAQRKGKGFTSLPPPRRAARGGGRKKKAKKKTGLTPSQSLTLPARARVRVRRCGRKKGTKKKKSKSPTRGKSAGRTGGPRPRTANYPSGPAGNRGRPPW